MTLVLELPTELEAALNERARERGVSVEELVLEGAREKARDDEKNAERARIWSQLQGSAPNLPSYEERMVEKREEIEREEAKIAGRI